MPIRGQSPGKAATNKAGKVKGKKGRKPFRKPQRDQQHVFEADDPDREAEKAAQGQYDEQSTTNYQYQLPSNFEDEDISEDDVFNERDYELYGDMHPTLAEPGKPAKASSKNKPSGKAKSSSSKGKAASTVDESDVDDDGDAEDDDEDGDGVQLSDLLQDASQTSSKPQAKAAQRRQAQEEASDDDQSVSDALEEDEDDQDDADDGKHDQLMNLIAQMRGAAGVPAGKTRKDRKPSRPKPAEVTGPGVESEFGLAEQRSGDGYAASTAGKLTLSDLVSPLKDVDAVGYQSLKRKIASIRSDPAMQTLPEPLADIRQEELDRKVAYTHTKTELRKWVPIVKRNRESEHVSFPLNPAPRQNLSHAELTTKFQPSNSLEKDLESILQTYGLKEEEEAKREADELKQKDWTPEELEQRQAELAKMKNLLFYHEKKLKQINRIKSKAYRRLRKKMKGDKDATDAADEDPNSEEAKARQLKAEFKQAEERMRLRHKNMSKWVKRNLGRGKFALDNDPNTRQAIAQQLKIGDELRKKMHSVDGADNSASEDEQLNGGQGDSDPEGLEEWQSDLESDEDVKADKRERRDQRLASRIAALTKEMDSGPFDLPQSGANEDDLPDGFDEVAPGSKSKGEKPSGLFALKFMQRALDRQKQEAKASLLDDQQTASSKQKRVGLKADKTADAADDDEEDADDSETEKRAAVKKSKRQGKAGKSTDSTSADGGNGASQSQGRRTVTPADGDRKGRKVASLDDDDGDATVGQAAALRLALGTLQSTHVHHSVGSGLRVDGPITVAVANGKAPSVKRSAGAVKAAPVLAKAAEMFELVEFADPDSHALSAGVAPDAQSADSKSAADAERAPAVALDSAQTGSQSSSQSGTRKRKARALAQPAVLDNGNDAATTDRPAAQDSDDAELEAGSNPWAQDTGNVRKAKRQDPSGAAASKQGAVQIDVNKALLVVPSSGSGKTTGAGAAKSGAGKKTASKQHGVAMAGADSEASDPTPNAQSAQSTNGTEPRHSESVEQVAITGAGEGEDVSGAFDLLNGQNSDQVKLVQQAFAVAEDFAQDFAKEKQRLLAEADGTKPDAAATAGVPGWGSWVGMGAEKAKAKRAAAGDRNGQGKRKQPGLNTSAGQPPAKRLQVQPASHQASKPARKDDKLPHVIVNEKRDKKAAKYMVQHVPFPYTSRDQYEQSMRNPIGPDWNTYTQHQSMVKPAVITQAGAIINPITYKAPAGKKKRKAANEPTSISNSAKKQGKKGRSS